MRFVTLGASMTDRSDPDQTKGPGGMTLRELHERVKRGHLRDLAAKQHNKLAQPQNRWQRIVRYVWDKKRG